MKKRFGIFLTAFIVMVSVMCVIPTTEVKAVDYYSMNFDQIVDFWSSQPGFQPIFAAEAMNSPYEWNIKTNVKTYFRASLVDYCVHPDVLNNRPYTKAYCQGVVANMNPYIYQELVCGHHSFTIQERLLEEMNAIAPYLSYDAKCKNVAILASYLNSQGVYTVDQYEAWKVKNGGMTAFEVYCHQVKDLSDEWTNQVKAASAAQDQYFDQVAQQTQEAQEQIQQQISDAYEQQQQMFDNMFD